jgi:hypothetical protein
MPAGLYRIVSDDNPVLITKGASLLTSAQARAHMLCAECEGRLNKGGEEWVIENCWRDDAEFPIRTALLASTPIVDESGFRAYDGRTISGVGLDRLVYFAASVFWRAALDGWRIGKGRPSRLLLGPYEEELRLFLMREAPFPRNVMFVVTISAAQDDLNNRNILAPDIR